MTQHYRSTVTCANGYKHTRTRTHTHTDTHTDRPEPSIEHERAVAGELGEHLHQVVADKGKTQKNLTRRQKNQKVTENIR